MRVLSANKHILEGEAQAGARGVLFLWSVPVCSLLSYQGSFSASVRVGWSLVLAIAQLTVCGAEAGELVASVQCEGQELADTGEA